MMENDKGPRPKTGPSQTARELVIARCAAALGRVLNADTRRVERLTVNNIVYDKCFVKEARPNEQRTAALTAFKSSLDIHTISYILLPVMLRPALSRSHLLKDAANTISAFTQFGPS